MATLHSAPTDALPPTLIHDIRSLLETAFSGAFTDDDWNHTIGGIHVWLIGAHGPISHGSLIERTIVCAGVALRVGFVEAVATDASQRRQGHGTGVMSHIDQLIREHYPLGVLSTGTPLFYETLGWERWRGPTFVNSPSGRERTPADDGDIMVLWTPHGPLDSAIASP